MREFSVTFQMAVGAALTVAIQGHFIASTDPAIFSSVPLTAGYMLLLALGAIASWFFLAWNLLLLFRNMSGEFLGLLFLALIPLAIIWTLSAFMQWNAELLRWLLVLVVLVAVIRIIQRTSFEPDGLCAFEPATDLDETLPAA